LTRQKADYYIVRGKKHPDHPADRQSGLLVSGVIAVRAMCL
jgi:hypothetical protein